MRGTVRRRGPLVAAVSLLAFFVVVGTGLARQSATKPVPQTACANGAVKGIVLVVADQNRGFQTGYVSDPTFFKTRWSCKAGTTFQARRVDRGVYDVRLAGNTGGTPLVTPLGGPVKVGTTILSDGGVRVTLIGTNQQNGQDTGVDESFLVVFV